MLSIVSGLLGPKRKAESSPFVRSPPTWASTRGTGCALDLTCQTVDMVKRGSVIAIGYFGVWTTCDIVRDYGGRL